MNLFFGAPPSSWSHRYYCYPVSFIDRSDIEKTNKILLPPSALDEISRTTAAYPLQFAVRNDAQGRVTHCGVLEFIAEEGRVYMPYWMMENLLLQPGDQVHLKTVQLNPGSYVKLRPQSVDFIDLSNPKAVLENSLREFSTLTVGDVLKLTYLDKHYFIEIVELKPDRAVSVVETDMEVDFAPPVGYVEPERPAAAAAAAAASGGSGGGSGTTTTTAAAGSPGGGLVFGGSPAGSPAAAAGGSSAGAGGGGGGEDDGSSSSSSSDSEDGDYFAKLGGGYRLDGKGPAPASASGGGGDGDEAAERRAAAAAAAARRFGGGGDDDDAEDRYKDPSLPEDFTPFAGTGRKLK